MTGWAVCRKGNFTEAAGTVSSSCSTWRYARPGAEHGSIYKWTRLHVAVVGRGCWSGLQARRPSLTAWFWIFLCCRHGNPTLRRLMALDRDLGSFLSRLDLICHTARRFTGCISVHWLSFRDGTRSTHRVIWVLLQCGATRPIHLSDPEDTQEIWHKPLISNCNTFSLAH